MDINSRIEFDWSTFWDSVTFLDAILSTINKDKDKDKPLANKWWWAWWPSYGHLPNHIEEDKHDDEDDGNNDKVDDDDDDNPPIPLPSVAQISMQVSSSRLDTH